VWTYRTEDNRITFNCAVKDDCRNPSRIEWVESCLNELVRLCRANNLKSLALPWMGAMNGWIPVDQIKTATRRALSGITDIDISVFEIRNIYEVVMETEVEFDIASRAKHLRESIECERAIIKANNDKIAALKRQKAANDRRIAEINMLLDC
jgi:hypothetical protein